MQEMSSDVRSSSLIQKFRIFDLEVLNRSEFELLTSKFGNQTLIMNAFRRVQTAFSRTSAAEASRRRLFN